MIATLLVFLAASPAVWTPSEGARLVGTPAPEWVGLSWIQGGPLRLADLRGKVVLLRFWLMDCPFCARTAPALRELSERYKEDGLVVVGLHHPKSEGAKDTGRVRKAAQALGFDFPIGVDNDWKTVRAYGVGSEFRSYTSVSFVIDREGVIRFVHDGGEYHAGGGDEHAHCNAALVALEQAVQAALKPALP
jgi:peroxiredoxin